MKPVEQRLGVETNEVNQSLVLVQKLNSNTVTDLLNTLTKYYPANIVSSSSITLENTCYLVIYKVRGHEFYIIQDFGYCYRLFDLRKIAQDFSNELSSPIFTFEQSDTGLFSKYSVWESGFISENFVFYEEGLLNHNDDTDLSDFREQPNINRFLLVEGGVLAVYDQKSQFEWNCAFYTTSRKISGAEIVEPYQFVSDTFLGLGIYIPGTYWSSNIGRELIEAFYVAGASLSLDDIDEIIFVQIA